MEIIALSGKAGSGKDFIFDHYLKPLGYYRWALADHFKIWIIGRGLATHEEVYETKPPKVREALQKAGTEEGRLIYGEEVWLNTAYAWIAHISHSFGIDKFCITDCRFKNEADYIKDRGGKVLRIIAPDRVARNKLTVEQRRHPSEIDLDDYFTFYAYIYNNPTLAHTVKKQIDDILEIFEIIEPTAATEEE